MTTDCDYVAARDKEALISNYGRDAVKSVEGYDHFNAVIVVPQEGEKQLWVRPDFKYYRSAWETALGQIPSGYDVDHVYHKARSGQGTAAHPGYGYAYVRAALVLSGANRSAGAGYEKSSAKIPHSPRGELPPLRKADFWQRVKLQNIRLGAKSKGYPGRLDVQTS